MRPIAIFYDKLFFRFLKKTSVVLYLEVEIGLAAQVADLEAIELVADDPLLGVDVLVALLLVVDLFAVDRVVGHLTRDAPVGQPVDDQTVRSTGHHLCFIVSYSLVISHYCSKFNFYAFDFSGLQRKWAEKYTALKLLWNCSEMNLKLLWNESEMNLKLLWNCSETALKLLWNESETALKWIWNCSETGLNLLWNCPEMNLKWIWNCSETALKLLWNESETALKLLWNCIKLR